MMTLEEWRLYREQSVAGEQGDLALIGLFPINEPSMTAGQLPGRWSPLSNGELGLTVEAAAEEGITVDGKPLEGTTVLLADRELVRFSADLTAAATEQPGSPHLLALWDAKAEAISRYEGISFYPSDDNWILPAEWVKEEDGRVIAFTHNADEDGVARIHQSPGDIRFVKDGVSYTLTPFVSGDQLIVVFGDRTNGKETYGLGRMLIVQMNDNGAATLDFNRAFLPPCAFSYHFNCPLPPAHNRLPFDIQAGEKQVRFRE
ncbi:DUF1684 domain-containing protein [Paenibacillus sp. NEAU-GSW1]|uniref:DUF1684 domain-containing protein n=1 Tax=Paenibacillus sp. NEAU-GSW1 TaxID=2682486 RepID=UPI0012E2BAFF|nr:DUF1684 domain-containing protein [Paenibacillus sp. NEAU-GSW1]MUT64580.1 DUF1684 domain-containing protein [Paenibacillus sp. NEAU-GSW1]